MTDQGGGSIYEFTPGGVHTNLDYGSGFFYGLAINSAGDLFVTDPTAESIYEFTPGGVPSTFASGVGTPTGLAFNSAGDLFVTDDGGSIYEFTPDGTQSTFASGLDNPGFLTFQYEPKLAIIPSGPYMILTWPTNATGFTLQSTTSLVPPAAWSTVSPSPVIVDTNNIVVNTVSGTQMFYRLSR